MKGLWVNGATPAGAHMAILLSGQHVVVESRALVGFHQANMPEGTALYVDYLRELGLTEQQIGFMVAAPFNGRLFATRSRARALGFQWQTILAPLGVSQCQAHYCLAWP